MRAKLVPIGRPPAILTHPSNGSSQAAFPHPNSENACTQPSRRNTGAVSTPHTSRFVRGIARYSGTRSQYRYRTRQVSVDCQGAVFERSRIVCGILRRNRDARPSAVTLYAVRSAISIAYYRCHESIRPNAARRCVRTVPSFIARFASSPGRHETSPWRPLAPAARSDRLRSLGATLERALAHFGLTAQSDAAMVAPNAGELH